MAKVLIIDDENIFCETLRELLHYEGYEAYSAASGIVGIEIARQVQPDLIICDIMMPDLDGYGVLKAIRNHVATAHIPFIFISVLPLENGSNLSFAPDHTAYLIKPFTYKEFLQTVQRVLPTDKVTQV